MNSARRQVPLSVGQEAMWVSWKLAPQQWTHIIPTPFAVRGELDMARLRAAVEAVGVAYPQLRGRVATGADGLVLDWSDGPPIDVRDSTFVDDRDEAVRRTWQVPFDLRRGPLARVDVLRGVGQTVLVLAVHHIVYDGASILILVDALRRAYGGEPLPPDDPGPALAGYAGRTRELADTVAGDAHRDYWRAALDPPAPPLDLPRTVDQRQYTMISEVLPGELAARLRSRATDLDVSYLTVLLAGYYALLRRHTGAEDVLAFLPFHGRTVPAVRDRVGYFVNALPIRCDVRGSDRYVDLIHRVRGQVRAATDHGELPLPAIMRAAGLTGADARERTHRTIFQFWHAGLRDGLDVQNLPLRTDGAAATLSLLDMESVAGFTLAVMVREDSAGTHVLWKDPTGVVGATNVATLSADYRAILTELADDPTATLAAVTAGAPTAVCADFDRGPVPAAASTVPADSLDAMTVVWQRVLGVDGIAADDSFFELGGHSLLAENLVLAVSDHFDTEVPIRTLFEYPRLTDFTAQVTGRSVDSTPPGEPTPASGFQQRIWLAERLDPGTAVYNVPLAWRISGRLRADALATALAGLVERHELLRTEFHERDGELWQVVVEPWLPEVATVDLRAEADPRGALRQWLADAAHRDFDPVSGRLLAAALIDVGENDQILFLCLHHLVWDGASMEILLRELDLRYGPVPTPAGPAQPAEALTHNRSEVQPPDGAMTVRNASPHQERMWFIHRFEDGPVYPTAPTYHNLPLFLRVERVPEPAALADVWSTVVHAHEALRTGLDRIDGRLGQRVRAVVAAEPEWLPDPSAHTGPGIPRPLAQWAALPFDLVNDCLLRLGVLHDPAGGGWLAFVGHQAVVDRSALVLVAHQLLDALAGCAPRPSSYADWLDSVAVETRQVHRAARAARLRPMPEPLRLPERRTRDLVHIYEERSVAFQIPADLGTAGAAARLAVDPADLLLAAFAALLGWYTGQQEMVLGVSHPARTPEDRHVVGPLANLLPVRLHPAVDRTFAELVAQTATELAHARIHDRAWFDELVHELDPPKDMSRTALFDVLFSLVDGTTDWTSPDGPAGREVQTASGYGKYDLHLFLQAEADGYAGWLVFNGRYFDQDQMQAMAEHYRALLAQLLAAPDRTVGAADPLTEEERYTQVSRWNATEATYPRVAVTDLIRRQATARPHAVAVTADGASMTYQELMAAAESTARALRSHGVQDGDLVALLLPRGIAQVQAMLAVLLSGAAYLPIEPGLPADRVRFILSDSGTRWAVVADPVGHPGLNGFTGRVLPVTGPSPAEVRLPDVPVDAPAYCIYTSGTTGRPKGVVITHHNLVRLLDNDRLPFAFGPTDVWTMFHSYAFDFSVWELFGALVHGGRVVIVSEEQARDPRLFWELLLQAGVTVLSQTPSAFRRLLDLDPEGTTGPVRLRYVIFGGEALLPAVLSSWMDRYPHVRLVNMYGITETTVHTSVRTVSRADVEHNDSVIGVPIPTSTLLLLDPHTGRRLLPVGAVGEIYVGGAGVAHGYLRRPELTAQRFVTAPFGSGTLFRSGDLARYRPDGTVQFIGRSDAQVQLRGYRVEPGEVEVRLCEHPAVAGAFVFVDGDRLVAVIRRHRRVSTAELRGHLARQLPEYMIPSMFQTAEEFPLTASGKLDTAAVRAAAVPLDAEPGCRPDTPTAVDIAAIWSRLLGVDLVGADDSFFALGGHSMLAIQLVAELRRRYGVEVPVRTLFESPKLRDLASLIDGQRADGGPADRPPRSAVEFPATAFQRRLWLAENLDERIRNNVVLAFEATGRFDLALLSQALNRLVADHELLRTAFRSAGDAVRQAVMAAWQPPIEVLDAADPRAEAVQWLDAAASRPFDLSSGRLLRVAVADPGGGKSVLLLCLHHLVIDGDAIPVLLTELDRYYRAAAAGEPAAPPAIQYRDFVAAEAAAERSGRRAEDLAYWYRRLVDAPRYLDLPHRPAPDGPDGAVTLPLPADLGSRLRPLQATYGVTWFSIFGTALAVALRRWTGQSVVTIGVPVSIRRSDFAELLGPCLNTVVLRCDVTEDAALREVLTAVQTELLDAVAHAGVSFEEVIHRLVPDRVAGLTPYVDVTLNMNLRSARRTTVGGVELRPWIVDSLWSHEAKFAITLTVAEQDGEFSAILSYRGARVSREAAAELAATIHGLLNELAEETPRAAARPGDHRVQYRHFVAGLVAARERPKRQYDLAYWEKRLAGAPPFLDAFSPPERPGSHGAVRVPLPADLLERVRPLQERYGLSLFMVVAATLVTTLHRWTGEPDVVVSSPMINRPPQFAGLLGPCLNTVALRNQLVSGTTVREVVDAVRTEVLGAIEHGEAPFEEVVTRLNPPRRAGRTPYADVTLVFEATPAGPQTLGGLPLRRVDLDRHGAGYVGKLGLTVACHVKGGRISCHVAYRGDRYRRDDVARFAEALGQLLTKLPDCLDQPVTDLVLAEDAWTRIRQWEDGPQPEPVTPVPALVARQGRERPSALAVDAAQGTLTYGSLMARARALGGQIRARLSGPDPVVALLLPRGAELPVAMLATWLAGAAFCPIDPGWPDDRVDLVLADLAAPLLLTDLDGQARAAGTAVLRVDQEPADAPDPGHPLPDPTWAADSTAYVVYTSGTTGRPKGVVVTHGGLARLIQWAVATYQIDRFDRCAQLLGVAFDATQWEVWYTLAAGACLVPHTEPVVASTLGEWLDRREISVATVTTPAAEVLWAADAGPRLLRQMFVGGAALTDWPPSGLPYRLANAYGPTEGTIVATVHDLPPVPQPPLNRIGRPSAGVRVHVLDAEGRRAPIGVAGRIFLAGTGLAVGYLRQPALTLERFRDVRLDGAQVRAYDTGDLGRWLPDGTLEYLGRVDRQLKIRGYRIEPAEIERTLRTHPGVGQAIVVGDARKVPALVAYVTGRTPGQPDTAGLLEHLRTRLPAHMVPEAVVRLAELPLGPNGKIDEAALPRPTRADLTDDAPVAPSGDLEGQILALWAEVLGTASIGVHDNFFDLGGNSLALARLHSRLMAVLGRDISIVDLFAHPTVAALAGALDRTEPGPAYARVPRAGRPPRRRPGLRRES